MLIVSGMLVGASGTLLTLMMARAMNRSVANVFFGAFGQLQTPAAAAVAADGGTVRSTTAEDVGGHARLRDSVIIVPGYGLAVAQAQHDVRELADELEKRGVEVKYAIHPVAGRMPGHMNVLLAEANVPYDAARRDGRDQPGVRADRRRARDRRERRHQPGRAHEPRSPIYGMPILNVDQAQNVVVLKRSMRPGFAGIDNPLFIDPNTQMLFGDAHESVVKLVAPSRRFERRPRLYARATSRRRYRRNARSRPSATRSSRYARGEWSMPPKVYVTGYPAGDFRAMPALGGGHALLKWVTSFPGNPARGLPTVTGVVLLSDAENGAAARDARRGRGDGAADRRSRGAGGRDARPHRRHRGRDRRRRQRPGRRAHVRRARADVLLWDVDAERAAAVAEELGARSRRRAKRRSPPTCSSP